MSRGLTSSHHRLRAIRDRGERAGQPSGGTALHPGCGGFGRKMRIWLRRRPPRALRCSRIATAEAFDDAVVMLLPHIQPIDDWTYAISRLLEMGHPQETAQQSTLRLYS